MGYIEDVQQQKINKLKADKLDALEQKDTLTKLVNHASTVGYEKGLNDIVLGLQQKYGGKPSPKRGFYQLPSTPKTVNEPGLAEASLNE